MVTVNYSVINDEFFINYLKFLVNRVFKILPISETEPDTLKDYLNSLILELTGSKEFIANLKNDANFLSLLGTLQYIEDNKCSKSVLRREVFKCIKIVEKLQEKYK